MQRTAQDPRRRQRAGRVGGGELLASGQTGATRIRVDAKFVYWMTPTAVFKLAK